MTARVRAVIAMAGAMLVATHAFAAPDLASRRPVGPLLVYGDDQRTDLFYYGPPEIRLATGPDGQPDFSFLQMRYTGNVTSQDRGLVLHRSLITIGVLLPSYPREVLAQVSRSLGAGGRGVELRPLPIRRLEAALVYASVGGTDTATRTLSGGRFGGVGSAKDAGEAYWSERTFTIGLDSLTAQVFQAALEAGQIVMSLGYAFVADGRLAAEPWGSVDGPRELTEALSRELSTSASGDSAGRDSVSRRVVRPGAIRVGVDLRRWPGLLRRVDLDGRTPEGFPALEVYCYDFRDGRRPDLYEKRVEIEAESVGGESVRLGAVFARAHPDVWRASVRFPVAVKLARTYRYRVSEIRPDGTSATGAWREGRGWVALLDLTTPASPTSSGVRPIR